jgi:hypothetical protein
MLLRAAEARKETGRSACPTDGGRVSGEAARANRLATVGKIDGARERTRTSTTLRSLAPEASASASSATRARVLWVKPRPKPGLQFQRGFFIVPAACCFVNERPSGRKLEALARCVPQSR